MTDYQLLIQAFDIQKPTTIHEVKLRLKISPFEKGDYIEGALLWLVKAGLISTKTETYKNGHNHYTLTAKGHCYALNKRCPLEDSRRRKKLW
tara:strand:+ start:623 stop:898 length:276 start_codon:yes stop_codon:yes gene_type:complete